MRKCLRNSETHTVRDHLVEVPTSMFFKVIQRSTVAMSPGSTCRLPSKKPLRMRGGGRGGSAVRPSDASVAQSLRALYDHRVPSLFGCLLVAFRP